MSQKPAEPQASKAPVEGTVGHSWLFLFYKWVTGIVTSILGTDVLVKTASSDFTAERVVTDTTSVTWDWSTAGQAKANVADEYVQDTVGAMLADTTSINLTYTDATGLITADVYDEYVQDVVGTMVVDSSSINFTYDDGTGQLTGVVLPAGVDHGGLAGLSDDDHTQYYLVNATRGMNGADFNRVAANPGDTDTLWMDDGTTYAAGTLVAPMPAVFLDEVSFGTPGDEQGSITVNGATYDALVKINEFGGSRDAALILHRHHTTNGVSAGLVFAKAATDDATHAAVTDGERLGEIIAVGHDGTDYAQSSAIRFVVDGTPGSNDMPGAIVFLTAPDGSQTIAEAFRISPAGHAILGGRAAASELRFLEPSGSGTHYTAFKAQAQAGDVTYTLPAADGSANDVLTTNGSGTLSWAAGGSGSDSAPMTPQGRLTLTAATPVMTAEAANQTTIYYTPYVGDICPIYNGSTWDNTQFAELSIAMAASANWAANTNYDLFVVNDGGTIRLVTGPAWSSATARGTGAGTTELERKNGIWTNKVSMTGRYGASSTMTVDANRGTYVGTFRTSANGTTQYIFGGNGAAAFLYLWNAYNRVVTTARGNDSASSWTYSSDSWRGANGGVLARASFVIGLAEDSVFAQYTATGEMTVNSGSADQFWIGVGLSSTTAPSFGSSNLCYLNNSNASDVTVVLPAIASYNGVPGIGFKYVQGLERARAGTITFYGDNNVPSDIQASLILMGMF